MFKQIKERSTDGLLKAAKRLTQKSPSLSTSISTSVSVLPLLSQGKLIKINNNKRSHEIRKFVELNPAEFMSWWITSTKVKRKASNDLLHYLKYKFNVDIPTDYRTLLKTPANPVPLIVFPGSYIHIGVREASYRLLAEAGATPLTIKLIMQFFIDGLKISRSTKDEFWIIMTNILNPSIKRLSPKVIGVYYGQKKPQDFNEFLWPFVMELLDLLKNGIQYNDKNFQLEILNFVLDAPARTSSKAVKHINGYFGCDYCLEEGDYIDYRMTFSKLNAELRNDVDYRSRAYEDYHHKESVLEMLPIDMVDAFPPDYLHFLLLGVVQWILTYICSTPKLLSLSDFNEIKRRVDLFQKCQPTEFQKKLRSFTEYLGMMKGTEFRQYVMFVGPLLFKGILSDEVIGNFLKLHIASIIFSHKRFKCYYEEGDQLMRMFIKEFAEIYHPRHVVYCFHSLCHIKKYVEKYGPLDNFSTFEYESFNCTVKKLLQSNVMPLTQVTNRIVEVYNSPLHDFTRSVSDIEVKGLQDDGTYSQLKYYDLTFRVATVGQNLVLLKSGQAVKLIHILVDPDTSSVNLIGVPFLYRSSVYGNIVDTTRFNIFKSADDFGQPITFKADDIDGKYWKLIMSDSNASAYYPIYVDDGKSFSREQQPDQFDL